MNGNLGMTRLPFYSFQLIETGELIVVFPPQWANDAHEVYSEVARISLYRALWDVSTRVRNFLSDKCIIHYTGIKSIYDWKPSTKTRVAGLPKDDK